jgi:STE24 endopeptidase
MVRRSPALRSVGRALGPLLLATAGAELAVRLLSPSEQLLPPEPVVLRDHFSDDEIARGRRYARPQAAIALARGVIDAAALGLVVARHRAAISCTADAAGAAHPAAPQARADGGHAVLAGAATGAALSAALTLPGLPLAALARRRALAVGLATQTWAAWGSDLVKGTAIQSAMAGAGGAGLVALMRRWPSGWWLPGAVGSVAVGAGLAALAPVVLDPIFNDFTPLPEGETRADVLALARAAGVSVGEVYSVDASRRTTAANAYVTGLGPTKRVVLFDTLLERYSRDEVRVVVAHELGHVRHRDVLRSVAFAALTAPATALAAQRLGWELAPDRGTSGSLPALAFALGVVSAPAGLISYRLSRRIERRADAFSLELAGTPEAFVSFERTIALQNVADIEPPRIVELFSTHPSTGERIGTALAFRNRRAAPAATN